jgi:putative sterol carrier protein
VAGFLTTEWLEELDALARTARPPEGAELVVQQVVTDPSGDVAYSIVIRDGAMAVTPGVHPDAQVTFRQDRATAAAIARGELSAQAAFLDGRLRLGGDLTAVLDRASALTSVDDVFAAARARTTWG